MRMVHHVPTAAHFRLAPYGTLKHLAGILLTGAAAFHAYQIISYGRLRDNSLGSTTSVQVPVVMGELLLGLWLVMGLNTRVTRIVACVVFLCLLEVALWHAIEGRRTCGCFGALEINPWVTVIADSSILVGLLTLQPVYLASAPASPMALSGFVLAALCIGVPTMVTITLYKVAANDGTLQHDRVLQRTIEVPLDDPLPSELIEIVKAHTGMSLSVHKELRSHPRIRSTFSLS
jgi:hypothetical protein